MKMICLAKKYVELIYTVLKTIFELKYRCRCRCRYQYWCQCQDANVEISKCPLAVINYISAWANTLKAYSKIFGMFKPKFRKVTWTCLKSKVKTLSDLVSKHPSYFIINFQQIYYVIVLVRNLCFTFLW